MSVTTYRSAVGRRWLSIICLRCSRNFSSLAKPSSSIPITLRSSFTPMTSVPPCVLRNAAIVLSVAFVISGLLRIDALMSNRRRALELQVGVLGRSCEQLSEASNSCSLSVRSDIAEISVGIGAQRLVDLGVVVVADVGNARPKPVGRGDACGEFVCAEGADH